MPTSSRPRVLIVAELCNPNWVSVPLEGWSHSQAIAKLADTHLVTHIRNRENILKAGLVEGEDFTAIDTDPVEKTTYKFGEVLRGKSGMGQTLSTALSALPYYLFETLLWKKFGKAIAAREYDVVHRVTPLSPTTPSILGPLLKRHGVPFVLGPLNGGVPWPKGFETARRREKEWLSYLRDAYKLMPGYRTTRVSASALICGSRDTREQVADRYQDKTIYIPENAIDPKRFTLKRDGKVELPIRAAFVGRLVPYKGADMLIEAAAPLVREGKVKIDVIGDGPEMPTLKALVEREDLTDGVSLAGWVKHEHLQEKLVQSHVFAFPSIREFGGAVVLESMALGLVPIVMDYGGPGELVSQKTGFAIPMGTRPHIIQQFRKTLEHLAANPQLLPQMGERARERVLSKFTWDAKAAQTFEVYRWVMGERDQPNFGMPLADGPLPGISTPVSAAAS
ncbi:MAG: glycosyltransferase family 4 protein [Myxococcaceae bacterium]